MVTQGVLLDVECIEIGTQADGDSWRASNERSNDPGFCQSTVNLQAPLSEPVGDQL
ncbi:hypothetical protein D3C76_1558790 [compost metagenome]